MSLDIRNWSKTKTTNVIGLVVFGFFAFVILFLVISKQEEERKKVEETKNLLNYFSKGFSNGSEDIVSLRMVVDSWGNSIEFMDFDEKGWYLLSAGPDGEFGTKDDIRNDNIDKNNLKEFVDKVKSKIEKVKEIKKAIGEAIEKIKE